MLQPTSAIWRQSSSCCTTRTRRGRVAVCLHFSSHLPRITHRERSPASTGYSFKAQALYAVVFVTRYLDLLQFISIYNTLMKLFYILTSFYILYSMRFRFRTTLPSDDPDNDTFRVAYLLSPCLLLALLFHYRLTPIDVLWSFSIFLESVAIAPQLSMLLRMADIDAVPMHYLAFLSTYRALYIVNWVYRYFVERRVDPIAAVGGIIQTGVWIFYFCVYFIYVRGGIQLPQTQNEVPSEAESV